MYTGKCGKTPYLDTFHVVKVSLTKGTRTITTFIEYERCDSNIIYGGTI